MRKNRIDVHFHAIAPKAYSILYDLGINNVGGVPVPIWDEAETLAFMDKNGIATAILSASDFPVPSSVLTQIHQIARVSNDFYANMIVLHPKRFGAFASLPLPDIDASLKEITYALDVLHLDGVMLLSNYEGYYLGDSLFTPILEELNRRKAVVFIHPGSPLVDSRMQLDLPNWLVEYVLNTTRAVTNLVVSDCLSRYTDIRFILAHAGGAFPYLMQRLLLGYLMKVERVDSKTSMPLPEAVGKIQKFNSLMRCFYCDTALSAFPSTLATLRSVVGNSHILFGSDYPYAPLKAIEVSIKILDHYPLFDFIGHNKIARRNSLRLFPRFS